MGREQTERGFVVEVVKHVRVQVEVPARSPAQARERVRFDPKWLGICEDFGVVERIVIRDAVAASGGESA